MTSWRESASLIVLAKKSIEQCKKFNYNVLLFKRSEKSSFMGNHAVFPGGVFEKSDESQDWLHYFQSSGVTSNKLSELTRVEGSRPPIYKSIDSAIKKEISLRITAIRETFEEVGILLCKPKKAEYNSIYSHCLESFDRKMWQKAVHNDSTKFLELCKELNVIPDLWSLHEWAAWLTPATFKKRFETAFYIVAVNDQPNVIIEENEVKDYHWNSPDEFFQMFENKELWLPPPQLYELSRLSRKLDIEDVITFAKNREKLGTTLFLPIQYQLNNGMMAAYPGDEYYLDNPNECKDLIKINEDLEVINKKSTSMHRCCFEAFHKNYVEMNIEPLNGHIKPVTKSESLRKNSKL